jgi:hypothetical protein
MILQRVYTIAQLVERIQAMCKRIQEAKKKP